MQDLQRGQKLKLETLTPARQIRVHSAVVLPGATVDYSCFGLDAEGRLSDERYFIFYNQKASPCGGITMAGAASEGGQEFAIDLAKLPATIQRLVFVATIDGVGEMRQLQSGHWRVLDFGAQRIADFALSGASLGNEKALMLGELYLRESWRLAAVGQGFSGGLDAVLQSFGGTVAAEPAPAAPAPAAPSSPAKLSLEKKLEKAAPHLVNLAKSLKVSLEKKQLQNVVARVALVLDASGSMTGQYKDGDVQTVVDRLLPLALHFDDDGELDVWVFGKKFLALTPVGGGNVKDYINQEQGGWKNWELGSRTNYEPAVIADVMAKYGDSKLPAYVIFISDGGVQEDKKIKKLIVEAAKLPIFWQFVGIGGSDYGIFEKLDEMEGRVVDNCNFFALDDIHSVGEQELYERLLNEFPQWLQAARAKNILR